MKISKDDRASLRISNLTKKRFSAYGRYGDNTDSILNSLLDIADAIRGNKLMIVADDFDGLELELAKLKEKLPLGNVISLEEIKRKVMNNIKEKSNEQT